LSLVRLEPAGDWTAAGKLQPGDHIRSLGHGLLTVVGVTLDNAGARVYDLEVDGLQSFAVGEDGVWAHNARIRGKKRNGLFKKSGANCPDCGKPMVFGGPPCGPRTDRASVDHIDPQSKGG